MIEEFTRTAVTTLLVQGTGWVVAVLLGIYVWVLDKRYVNCQIAAEKAVKDQYEKRLTEFGRVLETVNQSSIALDSMQKGVAARTEAVNQLVIGFANLVRDLDQNRERWTDKGKELSAQLDSIQARLEDIQRRTK